MKKSALIIVDPQKDFCPGGALPLPGGNEIASYILGHLFHYPFDLMIVSRDWHPKDHTSFKVDGCDERGIWPPHCIQGTSGAALLFIPPYNVLLATKGDNPYEHPYPAMKAHMDDAPDTMVPSLLKSKKIDSVFVGGLALDFCVKDTVLDLLKEGYETFLMLDACRGLGHATMTDAVREMVEAGAKLTYIKNVEQLVKSRRKDDSPG